MGINLFKCTLIMMGFLSNLFPNQWNTHPLLFNYSILVWIVYDNTYRGFPSTQLLHKEYDLSMDLLFINTSTQELLL